MFRVVADPAGSCIEDDKEPTFAMFNVMPDVAASLSMETAL